MFTSVTGHEATEPVHTGKRVCSRLPGIRLLVRVSTPCTGALSSAHLRVHLHTNAVPRRARGRRCRAFSGRATRGGSASLPVCVCVCACQGADWGPRTGRGDWLGVPVRARGHIGQELRSLTPASPGCVAQSGTEMFSASWAPPPSRGPTPTPSGPAAQAVLQGTRCEATSGRP